ncbi:MAG: GNAT family N-acetyltransferase [Calditrichaceae bacterium]
MTDKIGKYRIEKLERADYAQWDQYVLNHPFASIFHTTAWANIIKTVFNKNFEILVIYKKDVLKGGLLYFPKVNLGIQSIPKVPLTLYQGLILQQSNSQKTSSASAEQHELTKLILENICKQYSYIDLTLCPDITDMRPYKWHKFIAEPVYTYTFEISEYDELSQQFSQSLRRKIKASSKENHRIVCSEDTDKFVKFVTDSYHYHKIKPPVSSDKIEQLSQLCIENKIGKLYYLLVDEKPVAALFVLIDHNHVYALFSGIDLTYRNLQFTDYLHALVLQQPEFTGKIFDFLGANTPELEPFKRSFGGDLSQTFRIIYYKNIVTRILLKIREKQHLLARQKMSI